MSCIRRRVTLNENSYLSIQYGDDDYDNMGDDDYDDFSKELNQYKKSKDRGRGKEIYGLTKHVGYALLHTILQEFYHFHNKRYTFILQEEKADAGEAEVKEDVA